LKKLRLSDFSLDRAAGRIRQVLELGAPFAKNAPLERRIRLFARPNQNINVRLRLSTDRVGFSSNPAQTPQLSSATPFRAETASQTLDSECSRNRPAEESQRDSTESTRTGRKPQAVGC
jgi:hypothetical protein